MLVYGDAVETVSPRQRLDEITTRLAAQDVRSGGLAAHARLTEIFIDAAELAQGLVDAEFEIQGADGLSPITTAATDLLLALAECLSRSWDSDFVPLAPDFATEIAQLASLPLPHTVECKRAEGYAFYALYPEAYLEAAEALGQNFPLRVVGIRSIGLGLAALVAAKAGAEVLVSVRPTGHPFARQVTLSENLRRELLTDYSEASFAVADEGPGLSGSSFGSVIDQLEAAGIQEERIHVFASHRGEPGAMAEPRHRERWRRIDRPVVEFETLFINTPRPARRLENWFPGLCAQESQLSELSGGAWRARRYNEASQWPPANIQQERRKYLLGGREGPVLLKFAGLGRAGQAAFARAAALSDAGLSPEALGFRHGFLAQRWQDDVEPAGPPGPEFLARVGIYLGFRAKQFSSPNRSGASPEALVEMLQVNTREALGDQYATLLEQFCAAELANIGSFRRVMTDNRLHAWEWLQSADGRLLKTDAVDHCAAHDLVGCQDIAWDIVGAGVEWALDPEQRAELTRQVELACGEHVDPALLTLMEPCYLAFQLGSYSMSSAALAFAPEDAARLQLRSNFYRQQLQDWLVTRL